MDAKSKLRQIIREELRHVLKEQARNWWQKPAEAEVDAHLEPSNVHEAKEPRPPRPGVGKKKSKKGGARFTSAGTIPPKKGRVLSDTQIKTREEIGKKMLNTFRRGGPEGKKFRDSLNKSLEADKLPTDRKHQMSKIWARASGMAATGATASDFSKKTAKKKKNTKKSTE